MTITVETQATIRDIGTSANCWGVGDGSSQTILIKAFQPGVDPYIKFIPGTGWVFSNDGSVGGESGLGGTAVIEDTIVDGVTDKAASQNAIFDALALKAAKATAIASEDANTVTSESVLPVTTSDAASAPVSYTQEHSNELVALANDLKTHLNEVITLSNEIKGDYNAATSLINTIKARVNTMNA